MPLDVNKLENLGDLADGMRRARCPACAEKGQDKTGEHLRIYPDGRFGCCVFPRDREHRKRIYALVGQRGRRAIKVRVAATKSEAPVLCGILGRLGRLFPSSATVPPSTDATDGVTEVETGSLLSRTLRTPETKSKEGVGSGNDLRTLRTGNSNSNGGSAFEGCLPLGDSTNLRTLRTPLSNPRAIGEKNSVEEVSTHTCKGFREGVRLVREQEGAVSPPSEREKSGGELQPAEKQGRMPYLTPDGTLVIPFDSPERFHWWKPDGERQSVKQIIAEVRSWASAARKEPYGTDV